MAVEFKLSYTANEINEKLGRVDKSVLTINGIAPDKNGNVEVSSSSSVTDEEVLELLMEMDIVQPIANQNGVLYINNNNKLYVL